MTKWLISLAAGVAIMPTAHAEPPSPAMGWR